MITMIGSVCSTLAQTRFSVPDNLVGNWFEGSTSILQEQSMTTGQISSKYGSSIGYVIN